MKTKESTNKKISDTVVNIILNELSKSPRISLVMKNQIPRVQNLRNILQTLKVGSVEVVIFPVSVGQGKFSTAIVPDRSITEYGYLLSNI